MARTEQQQHTSAFRAASWLLGDALSLRLKDGLLLRFPALHGAFAEATARRKFRIDVSKYAIDIVDRARPRRLRISRRNHPLVEGLVNAFDYYFDSVEPIQTYINGAAFDLVDWSTPRYHDMRGFADFPIFCPTMAEPYLTAQQYLVAMDVKPGETVVDLGAYCGLTAICFSVAVGKSGRVIAVEPDPENFRAAAKNIDRYFGASGASNITLVQAAAAAHTGKISFCAEGTTQSAAVSIIGKSRGRRIEADGVTLLELAEAHGLANIDVVKMDIEGGELQLLDGSALFLERFRPRLIVEAHVVDGAVVTDEVVEVLRRYDYDCEILDQVGSSLPLVAARPSAA